MRWMAAESVLEWEPFHICNTRVHGALGLACFFSQCFLRASDLLNTRLQPISPHGYGLPRCTCVTCLLKFPLLNRPLNKALQCRQDSVSATPEGVSEGCSLRSVLMDRVSSGASFSELEIVSIYLKILPSYTDLVSRLRSIGFGTSVDAPDTSYRPEIHSWPGQLERPVGVTASG